VAGGCGGEAPLQSGRRSCVLASIFSSVVYSVRLSLLCGGENIYDSAKKTPLKERRTVRVIGD
jgi:hypothetical protein